MVVMKATTETGTSNRSALIGREGGLGLGLGLGRRGREGGEEGKRRGAFF